MEELLLDDLRWILTRLSRDVKDILMRSEGTIFLAGGFIRACIAGEEINDVDLFAPDNKAALSAAQKLSRGGRVAKSGNAYTCTKPKPVVQVIHRWTYDSPVDLINDFDFTIASAVVWFKDKKWMSACHERFYADLAAKRLFYLNPNREEEAGGSMLRVLKFYQRGYRIPLDSLGAVTARLVANVHDSSMVNEPGGLARVITSLLREVDPLIDIDHLYLSHLPSIPQPGVPLAILSAVDVFANKTEEELAEEKITQAEEELKETT